MTFEPRYLKVPAGDNEEERLRIENHDLKRQLQELKAPAGTGQHAGVPVRLWRPSGITIWAIFLAACILTATAFFAGYLPLQKRRVLILNEAQEQERSVPRVEVIE